MLASQAVLLLEPLCQPFLVLGIFKIGSRELFTQASFKPHPHDLCFLSREDYRCEPLASGSHSLLEVTFKIRDEGQWICPQKELGRIQKDHLGGKNAVLSYSFHSRNYLIKSHLITHKLRAKSLPVRSRHTQNKPHTYKSSKVINLILGLIPEFQRNPNERFSSRPPYKNSEEFPGK
jgi:hypothetical protein